MNIRNEEGIKRFRHTVDIPLVAVGDPILSMGDTYMVIQRGDFRLSKELCDAIILSSEINKQGVML